MMSKALSGARQTGFLVAVLLSGALAVGSASAETISVTLYGDAGTNIATFVSRQFFGPFDGELIAVPFDGASYSTNTVYSVGFSSYHPSTNMQLLVTARFESGDGFESDVGFSHFGLFDRWLASSFILSHRLISISVRPDPSRGSPGVAVFVR